jgi:hypothetical protein
MSGVTSSSLPVGEYPTFLSVLAIPRVWPNLIAIASRRFNVMAAKMPSPIVAYFEAANGPDPDAVVACFAEDAHVRDEGRDHVGRRAVRDWAADARRRYQFRAEPRSIEPDADGFWVTAHLTGDFPGAPADLRYRFQLRDGKIADLAITLPDPAGEFVGRRDP